MAPLFVLKDAVEAVWTPVADGIELKLKPAGTQALTAARRAVRLAIREDAGADVQYAFVTGFIAWGAEDWRGIGDEAGEPLPFSSEGLALLLAQRPDIYERLDDDYVGPVSELLAEKKGSSPSPNGSSAGASATATPARRARKARTAAAKPAPTGKTSRAAKTATTSGA